MFSNRLCVCVCVCVCVFSLQITYALVTYPPLCTTGRCGGRGKGAGLPISTMLSFFFVLLIHSTIVLHQVTVPFRRQRGGGGGGGGRGRGVHDSSEVIRLWKTTDCSSPKSSDDWPQLPYGVALSTSKSDDDVTRPESDDDVTSPVPAPVAAETKPKTIFFWF